MGRASVSRAQNRELASTLRVELEQHIQRGQCAYCRAPARPDKPLTREHVIPRARGGRRNDVRIIVPACPRCNHRRGCRDLIPFLLARPRRLSSLVDYLAGLSPESIRQLDLRIFAEVYAAVAMLSECAGHGASGRWKLQRLCSGRALHRRRYAVRRAVGALSVRMEALRDQQRERHGPSCIIPSHRPQVVPLRLEEPLERLASRLLGLLALLWEVSAEVVEREMTLALSGSALGWEAGADADAEDEESEGADQTGLGGVVQLDGWKARPKRKRFRTDRRHSRLIRPQRSPAAPRGRAA